MRVVGWVGWIDKTLPAEATTKWYLTKLENGMLDPNETSNEVR